MHFKMVKIYPQTDAIIEVQVFDANGQVIPLNQINKSVDCKNQPLFKL